MTPITVLLADDHPVLRHGVKVLLGTEEDIEVVAEAANGAEAIALSELYRPDVVLMDVQMPVVNGFDATRRVCELLPGTKVGSAVFTDRERHGRTGRGSGGAGLCCETSCDAEPAPGDPGGGPRPSIPWLVRADPAERNAVVSRRRGMPRAPRAAVHRS